MYDLHIANKNYSSWSLRPWVLLSELGIRFTEHLHPFPGSVPRPARPVDFQAFSPSGKVPCLHDGDLVIPDSLAIAEYLAERHRGIWPADRTARAWARCAAAEMHAGFAALRSVCTMNCGIRVRLPGTSDALARELERLQTLWRDGLSRFGGPFLAGDAFGAVDAFFAPVAFRVQTYGLVLDEPATTYVARLLALPAMQRWYAAAIAEPWREPGHEAEVTGTLLADLRAT